MVPVNYDVGRSNHRDTKSDPSHRHCLQVPVGEQAYPGARRTSLQSNAGSAVAVIAAVLWHSRQGVLTYGTLFRHSSDMSLVHQSLSTTLHPASWHPSHPQSVVVPLHQIWSTSHDRMTTYMLQTQQNCKSHTSPTSQVSSTRQQCMCFETVK